MRNLFAAAIVLAAGSIAAADVSHYLMAVDNTGGYGDAQLPTTADHYTWDLMINVSGGDDWTSSAADVVLTAGTFYQHPFGGDTEPNSALFASFPGLEYDTFFASPPALFDNVNPGFASGPDWTDTTVSATWFDTPDDGDGVYTIARFTIYAPSVPGNGIVGNITGSSTAKLTGGDLLPFDLNFVVPAPGTAALLGLAGLAVRRRR
ncbi:MAG: hypothetical protein ACF8NJ_07665 [Phycisphaerales bacterium JB038]